MVNFKIYIKFHFHNNKLCGSILKRSMVASARRFILGQCRVSNKTIS